MSVAVSSSEKPVWRQILTRAVIVAALGYFVDIYDLILFGIVRVPSLEGIGVEEADFLDVGTLLINSQMVGMLLGGVLWGVLGDKRGRLSVLFGSITLYSIANIANAFVSTVEWYAVWRFIAGVGLAGELGAGITLVSETLPKHLRGYGTSLVAAIGILGAVAAFAVGEYHWPMFAAWMAPWQIAYLVGGLMGLALLVLRIAMVESGVFDKVKLQRDVARGQLRMLVNDRERFAKYVYTILVGVPVWFVIGLLVLFSREIAVELEATGPVDPAVAIVWTYVGASLGGLGWGIFSQLMGSRRWAVIWALAGIGLAMYVYLFWSGIPPTALYVVCFVLGLGTGYWAIFVTMAAEQFGTNLRATVATTAPNFVRGSLVPVLIIFGILAQPRGSVFGLEVPGLGLGIVRGAMLVGAGTLLLALFSVHRLSETYGKDLDYVERSAGVADLAAGPVPAPAK